MCSLPFTRRMVYHSLGSEDRYPTVRYTEDFFAISSARHLTRGLSEQNKEIFTRKFKQHPARNNDITNIILEDACVLKTVLQ